MGGKPKGRRKSAANLTPLGSAPVMLWIKRAASTAKRTAIISVRIDRLIRVYSSSHARYQSQRAINIIQTGLNEHRPISR